jgi:hypothetical protein
MVASLRADSQGIVRLEAGVIWEVKVLLQEMPTPGS